MEPQFLDVRGADGWLRKIAYLSTPGVGGGEPGFVWLPGLKSDMVSTKATILARWADREGVQMTRFDYSGHGQSEGDFRQGTVSRWLEESLAILRDVAPGPQFLVGSSMGGWLALLIIRHFIAAGQSSPIHGAILIAPAWDMTESLMWETFPERVRQHLMENGVYRRPSAYGEPYPITKDLIEDGRNHLLSGQPFAPGIPIRVLQGVRDADVPWQHVMALQDLLEGENILIQLIEDGEHRLSREKDIRALLALANDLVLMSRRREN